MAKTIIGLVGEMASGKDTVKNYLKEKHGAEDRQYSGILRTVLDTIGVAKSRENMQKTSTFLRQAFGEDILAKAITNYVKQAKSDLVVVNGVRRAADIEYLKKEKGFYLVAITADSKKRYERMVKRGENEGDDKKTYEDFMKDHEYETELSIPPLMEKAQYTLDNNGSFEDLYKQVDAIIKNLL